MDTIKLKLSEVISLHDGLLNLDGYQHTIKVGEEEQVIKEPYRFNSGRVAWNIAKNRRVLKPHIEAYKEASDSLIKEISGGIEIKGDDVENIKRYTEKINEVLKQEVEVSGLLRFSVDDLNLGKNPIPASVLLALESILDEPKTP